MKKKGNTKIDTHNGRHVRLGADLVLYRRLAFSPFFPLIQAVFPTAEQFSTQGADSSSSRIPIPADPGEKGSSNGPERGNKARSMHQEMYRPPIRG